MENLLLKSRNFSLADLGYFKYKSSVESVADCIREYPMTEFILDKIKNNQIPWEIEKEEGIPKKFNGKYIVLI